MIRHLLTIFLFALLLSVVITPFFAVAQSSCTSERGGYCVAAEEITQKQDERLLELAQAKFPGLEFLTNIDIKSSIGDILAEIYRFSISLVGLAAMGMIMYGGVMYLTAGDNGGRVGKAKTIMGNAVFGLVLALISWLILNTINPDFTRVLVLDRLGAIAPPQPCTNPPCAPPLPPPTTHLVCQNNSCIAVPGPGPNQGGCAAAEQSCGSVPPPLPPPPPPEPVPDF